MTKQLTQKVRTGKVTGENHWRHIHGFYSVQNTANRSAVIGTLQNYTNILKVLGCITDRKAVGQKAKSHTEINTIEDCMDYIICLERNAQSLIVDSPQSTTTITTEDKLS